MRFETSARRKEQQESVLLLAGVLLVVAVIGLSQNGQAPSNQLGVSVTEDLIADLLEDQGALSDDAPGEEADIGDSLAPPADESDADGAPDDDWPDHSSHLWRQRLWHGAVP